MSEVPSFLRLNNIPLCVYIPRFVYLFICQWSLGLLPAFGYCQWCHFECECTNVCLSPCFSSFGNIPRGGIARLYGNSIFKFLRNHQTILHIGCTILHSYHQGTEFPISPHAHQHLLFSVFYFDNSHPSGYQVSL